MLEFFFLVLLIGITFSFQPFVSSEFVPSEIRVPLLLIFTFLTILFSLRKKRIFYFLLIGGAGFIVLFSIWFRNSSNTLSDIAYVIVLSVFTYCLYSFFKRTPFLVWMLCRVWLFLLIFMSFSAIAAFVTYNLNLLPYFYTQVGPYVYYFNPLVGYVFVKDFAGLMLGRACNYMLEPSYLAFFLTTNFWFINSMPFSDGIKKSAKVIVFLGAFCTLSTGSWIVFTIVFAIAGAYWLIKKFNFNEQVAKYSIYIFLTLGFIVLAVIPKEKIIDLLGASSYEDRDNRMAGSFIIIATSSIENILLGHAPGFIEKNFDKGESNQYLKLLIEEGLVLTILIISFIVFCLKKNFKFMLAVLVFLNSVVILWTPLFLINIVLCRILTDNPNADTL